MIFVWSLLYLPCNFLSLVDFYDTKFNKNRIVPFFNKKFKHFLRTFKDTFPIFQGLPSMQNKALSLRLF